MKHLKTSELFKDKNILPPKSGPQIGDYVICADIGSAQQRNFALNNIGKIVEYIPHKSCPYKIYYENIPADLFPNHPGVPKDNARVMSRGEIIYFSPNKEDLEIYLAAKKYNL